MIIKLKLSSLSAFMPFRVQMKLMPLRYKQLKTVTFFTDKCQEWAIAIDILQEGKPDFPP